MTPVVLIAEELAPAALDVLADDFDVRHVDGTDRPALLAALAEAAAVIVRSATDIDAEAIAALRADILAVIGAASDGGPVTETGWTTAYATRRLAWHVLDHAWEMLDRSES